MEITLRVHQDDCDMVELFTREPVNTWLLAAVHIDNFLKADFFQRLSDGQEIAVELQEVQHA